LRARAADSLPCLDQIEQTPIIIEKILVVARPSELDWQPVTADGSARWSIGEVLAHLTHCDTIWLQRAQRMVEEQNPLLPNMDDGVVGAHAGKPGAENLRAFCHERDRVVTWLRYLPAAAAARTGRHAEAGPITLGQMLHAWACHDLGHFRQIAELYRAAALFSNMGAFQRYYTLKP